MPMVSTLVRLVRRLGYPRPRPATWSEYVRLAYSLGLTEATVFLSFDCDTDEDAMAMAELHDSLSRRGIVCTLAVPGAQLQNMSAIYRTLADKGLEFMNHGQAPHTTRRGDRYVSTTFYHEMSSQAVEEDIRQGHETVLAVTGTEPRGLRVPHFGLFQKAPQLRLIRHVARSLGYDYCSTTMPAVAMRHGPAFLAEGLLEFPLLGTARFPKKIFDSWSYLTGTAPYRLSPDYARWGIETMEFFRHHGLPGLFSWYADPSHVLGQPAFHALMEYLVREGIPSMTAGQLCRRFSGFVRGGR